MGVQFLSDWGKNATKDLDVLEILGRKKTIIRKESHKKQKIVSCKKSIERKLLV
ncbi:hypothetical protein [Helicobacter pylori]|uniref:hypothetical protein n=1 Tax=Helicobacter pylori TaxID=210 RepID=UPI00039ED356|nr:hypothetical protein [Helicobacter pylori]